MEFLEKLFSSFWQRRDISWLDARYACVVQFRVITILFWVLPESMSIVIFLSFMTPLSFRVLDCGFPVIVANRIGCFLSSFLGDWLLSFLRCDGIYFAIGWCTWFLFGVIIFPRSSFSSFRFFWTHEIEASDAFYGISSWSEFALYVIVISSSIFGTSTCFPSTILK
jgi:hypothetical protein